MRMHMQGGKSKGGHQCGSKKWVLYNAGIKDTRMRNAGERSEGLGHNLTSNTNFTPVQTWVNTLSMCLGPVPPHPNLPELHVDHPDSQ